MLSRRKVGHTKILLNPGLSIALLSLLVNLEPLGILRVELITSRAGALGEVGHERTGIVRPLERARKCL